MDVRLDIWLDVSCLFRTRSEAQKACRGGKVDVNGDGARPHRLVRVGDEVVITRPFARRQRVVVRALADRHIAKAEARQLYDDITPPPRPEEVELLRMERLARPFTRRASAGAPDRRERREIRRRKHGG